MLPLMLTNSGLDRAEPLRDRRYIDTNLLRGLVVRVTLSEYFEQMDFSVVTQYGKSFPIIRRRRIALAELREHLFAGLSVWDGGPLYFDFDHS